MWSQLQNTPEQIILYLMPYFLPWVAIFLFLAGKKIAALIVIGIAVSGYLMQGAIGAFSAGDFVFAVLWALLSIGVVVGVVVGLMMRHVDPREHSQEDHRE